MGPQLAGPSGIAPRSERSRPEHGDWSDSARPRQRRPERVGLASVAGLLRRDRCHAERADVVVHRERYAQGSWSEAHGDVHGGEPEKLGDLHARFSPSYGLADPYQMLGVLEHRAFMRKFDFTGPSKVKMTSLLLEVFREGRIRIPDDVELRRELLSLVVKETSSGFR